MADLARNCGNKSVFGVRIPHNTVPTGSLNRRASTYLHATTDVGHTNVGPSGVGVKRVVRCGTM